MDEEREHRSTFLSIILSVLACSGILFASFIVCGGLTLHVLALVAGLAVFGYIHYLLWGQAFSNEVADERADEEERQRLETPEE